ncbi:hypothetical protein BH11MYX4_BH11MYX4_18310 [soil metagenome]
MAVSEEGPVSVRRRPRDVPLRETLIYPPARSRIDTPAVDAVRGLVFLSGHLEFWRVPLARSPFFVTSMRGAIAAGIEPFCGRLVVNDLPDLATDDGFALRITW